MTTGLRGLIHSWMPSGRVARGIITLAGGTAIAQIIAIGTMPIVTRLYTPSDFGAISVFISFFAFWSSVLSLRYESTLLVAKHDVDAYCLYRLSLLLVVIMSLLGWPVLWSLCRADFLGLGILPIWSPYAAVPILLGQGIFIVHRSWALRRGLVKAITKASIARSACNSGARIALGLLGGGIPALFAAQLAGSWGAILGLAKGASTYPSERRFTRPSPVRLLQIGRQYIKFPLLETPSTLIDQLGFALPLPMVATLYGPAAAGWFGLAMMFTGAINGQIGAAVADVFQAEAARATIEADPVRLRALCYRFMGRLALFGLLPAVGVAFLAPRVVPWVFGSEWLEAGYVVTAIAPWLYAALVVSPVSRVLSVLQAQEYKLIYDISVVSLLSLGFLAASSWDLTFIEFAFVLSLAQTAAYGIYAVLILGVVEVYFRRSSI